MQVHDAIHKGIFICKYAGVCKHDRRDRKLYKKKKDKFIDFMTQ